MNYRIAEYEDVQPIQSALERLWADNLPLTCPARRRFEWYYRDNPAGVGHALLLVPEGQADEAAVGCAGVGVRTFAVRGKSTKVGLLADLAVDKAHRTVGPAIKLQRAVQAHARRHFTMTYGFPNKSAVGLYRRVGYRVLGVPTRYALVVRHAGYVRQALDSKPAKERLGDVDVSWLVEPAAFVLDRGLGMLRGAWAVARVGANTVDETRTVDDRFDTLFESAKSRYDVIAWKDAAFVRWRFLDNPHGQYDLTKLVGRDDSLRAYAATTWEGGVLQIADVLGRSLADEEMLVSELVRRAYQRGARAVSLRAMGADDLMDRLFALGFRKRESERTVLADGPEEGQALSVDADVLADGGRWVLTDADEDA